MTDSTPTVARQSASRPLRKRRGEYAKSAATREAIVAQHAAQLQAKEHEERKIHRGSILPKS